MMPAERQQNAAGKSEFSLGAIGGLDDPEVAPQDLGAVGRRRGPIGVPESDYVKLARQGGQRDLLKMPDNSGGAEPAVQYNRPDWLDHNAQTRSGQEKSSTARGMEFPVQETLNWSDIKAKYMTREAPFATDPVSLRQQTPDKLPTHSVGSASERSGSISSIPQNTVSPTHEFEGKPPPLKSNATARRQREETNMWTLMSFGYTGDSAGRSSAAKESDVLSPRGGNTDRPWATDSNPPKGAEQAKDDDDEYNSRVDLVKRYGSRSAGPTF